MDLDFTIALLALGILLLGSLYALRFMYDYRVTSDGIEVLLFRLLPVYRISVSDIEQIEILGRRRLWISPLVLRLGNRFNRSSVLIRRRTGGLRLIVITPDEPEQFVDHVRERMPPPS